MTAQYPYDERSWAVVDRPYNKHRRPRLVIRFAEYEPSEFHEKQFSVRRGARVVDEIARATYRVLARPGAACGFPIHADGGQRTTRTRSKWSVGYSRCELSGSADSEMVRVWNQGGHSAAARHVRSEKSQS